MTIHAHSISETFPVLTPAMDVDPRPYTGGMEFYQGLTQHFGDFDKHVLISSYEFNAPWDTWEMHPRGDEIVILMSGNATMALKIDGEQHTVDLHTPGQYIVVPRGAWHTATDATKATMLFITPGEGTENRESPPD